MRRIAWGWLGGGVAFVGITAAVAISHFGFGMPIYEAHTYPPRLATSAEILTVLIALGAGGSFFATLGAALLAWQRKR